MNRDSQKPTCIHPLINRPGYDAPLHHSDENESNTTSTRQVHIEQRNECQAESRGQCVSPERHAGQCVSPQDTPWHRGTTATCDSYPAYNNNVNAGIEDGQRKYWCARAFERQFV
jgi:hypothetical protein